MSKVLQYNTKNEDRRKLFVRMKSFKYAYILILPAVISVIIFSYLPMIGLVMAFKDYNIIKGIFGSPWVGFDNFIYVFSHPKMLLAIKNTIIISSVSTFLLFPFPIILALLFNELRNLRFKKVIQTVSYMPHFLSWISVIGLAYSFLAMEGPFNDMMKMLFGDGYIPKNILMDSKYFFPIIWITSLWKGIGWNSVIFLAAIAGIDPTLYEAAKMDGCKKLGQIWHITLPGIKTTVIIIFVMSMGSLLASNFEQVYGFQNLYTQEATEVISTVVYKQGIQNGEYSMATAFGLANGLVTILLILTANAISKKACDTSIW